MSPGPELEIAYLRPVESASDALIPLGRAGPLGGRGKRALDVAVALVTLVVVLPLMALIALSILVISRRSPFYAHPRVGYDGRIFSCYKFQTMVRDADAVLARLLANDPTAAAEWASRRKLRFDPRVEPFGRILRKTSLDELPQLVNVLRGDMSCIGPRPMTADELVHYGADVDLYLSTRPGLTGLWQVGGRSSTDIDGRIALDLRYVAEWSFGRDLSILARTPAALFRVRNTS